MSINDHNYPTRHRLTSNLKFQRAFIVFLLSILPASSLLANSMFEPIRTVSKLEYQNAAAYTHLDWQPNPDSPIKIKLLPIRNFSGIKIEHRKEKADYYYHGNIPQAITPLLHGLINASRYFETTENGSDYVFQLTIEKYKLPHIHAPDDLWWKKLKDDVDRWLIKPHSATVKLTLKITGGKRNISNRTQSIEARLSNCDINSRTQNLPDNLNTIVQQKDFKSINYVIKEFSKTSPGQAFIAANNYLILQAITYINQNKSLAQVIETKQNQILIQAENSTFSIGEKLDVYYKSEQEQLSALPAGQVEIIKTFRNRAVAYPVNLRLDQIKQGDWIEVGQSYPYLRPNSIFSGNQQCANVLTAES